MSIEQCPPVYVFLSNYLFPPFPKVHQLAYTTDSLPSHIMTGPRRDFKVHTVESLPEPELPSLNTLSTDKYKKICQRLMAPLSTNAPASSVSHSDRLPPSLPIHEQQTPTRSQPTNLLTADSPRSTGSLAQTDVFEFPLPARLYSTTGIHPQFSVQSDQPTVGDRFNSVKSALEAWPIRQTSEHWRSVR